MGRREPVPQLAPGILQVRGVGLAGDPNGQAGQRRRVDGRIAALGGDSRPRKATYVWAEARQAYRRSSSP